MKNILVIGICSFLISCGEEPKDNDKVIAEMNPEIEQENSEVNQESPAPIEAVSSDKYGYEMVVDGLEIPWGFDFLPDGSMIITEKKGEVILFKDGKKTKISGGPEVYNRGQGGLLDVKVHPEYESNGWIYFSYASEDGEADGGNTAIMRAKLTNDRLTDQEVLYKAAPNTTKGQHFGSRIVFDKDGYLFFTAGERGNREENPQDITRDNGKVYRLNADGTIPNDNPFVNKPNAKKAIFTYGNRNPQGMIVHPETGKVWIHEHGPQGGDEINVIKPGANYGWPVVTYGENYDGTPITQEKSKPGMENPIFYWLPSIAPSGFEYVTSDKFPDLKGHLLVGSLKFQYLESLSLDEDKITKREKLIEKVGRVRDVQQGPDGEIYIAVEGKGIVKLKNK